MTNYQTQTISPLIEPTTVIPAQLAPYIPPPQPTVIPGNSGQPGVIVLPNGESYYGHPPIVYAQPQALADPQTMAKAVERVGQGVQMIGAGGFAAGAGFGVSEVIGAVAGASVGTLLAVAALTLVAKAKAPKISTINHIREEYHQHVTNTATGWFGRATGSVNSNSSHTTSSTIS